MNEDDSEADELPRDRLTTYHLLIIECQDMKVSNQSRSSISEDLTATRVVHGEEGGCCFLPSSSDHFKKDATIPH